MEIPLVTNTISLKETTFNDWINKSFKKQEVAKTASTVEKTVKTASAEKAVSKEKPAVKTAEEKDLTKAQEKLPEGLKKAIEKKEGKDKSEDKKDTKSEPKKEDKKEDKKEVKEDKKEEKKEKDCTASKKTEFVRIAKLNSKTRSMLKDYFSTIYSKEYAEAMTKEY